MENQIDINQSVQIPEKPKINYWIISTIVLFVNDNYDKIRIEGSPNNVSIVNKSEWKTAFQQIDESNLTIFRDFMDSISL
ncbi:hypothetical protein COT44_02680 [Candidatus Shapirobacteria bacterium CG08_land_8_20_14_0_20_39_18]|uniref:Uncharacterized protein n=1 Tax=Candidatus Shapirobacteria bacterium CG08_land_8_20_14_0_20_39_18 TaxID=1974883 RepID=A0A2M6XCX8_9BACT|nr:MAG: hypothetical protein COT44_02680 [Candidatus Shapirobacteria bacterium CG08_land_8_20_14_0_20_39_18]